MFLDTLDKLNNYAAFFEPATLHHITELLTQRATCQFGTVMELDGKRLYARILRLTTMPRELCRYETHREYADLQCIVGGGELIDWIPRETLTPAGEYDESNDVQFYAPTQAAATMEVADGLFTLFQPTDAHRPQIRIPSADTVEKIVFKVHHSLLRIRSGK
jgi:biofilm protein TabA